MTEHHDSDHSPEIDDLLALARANDRSACQQLLEKLRPDVTRYCYSRIGTSPNASADVEDVVQEVMTGAFFALPRYQSNGAGFRAFVFGIAKNKIADFHRQHTRERIAPAEPPELPDCDIGPEETTLRTERNEKLRDLLNTLPATQRTILVLRVVVGLPTTETATIVSSTPGAVRVTQHRALTKLRQQLCPA